jgi:hypothetical protein
MSIRIAVVLLLAAACSKSSKSAGAYAVGAYVGPSSLSPSSDCKLEVDPPSAAKLGDTKTTGTLVAPGKLKVTCGDNVTNWDIVAPTTAKIHRTDGDKDVKVGEKATFQARPFGGDRELTTDGNFTVAWTPGPDCASTATTEVDMPAGGDSLHGTYSLELVGKAAGTCTLTAEVVGVKATEAVKIQ